MGKRKAPSLTETRIYRNEKKKIKEKVYFVNGLTKIERNRINTMNWISKNRDKTNLSRRLRYAVETGKIKKSDTCEVCGGEKNITGHHFDYSRIFDVVWICRKCHSKYHLGTNIEAELTRGEVYDIVEKKFQVSIDISEKFYYLLF
jgi:ribosomal protein L37AE/L43A